MRTATLESLRALVHSKTQRSSLPFSYLPTGIPKGAIAEISGHGKSEFVLKFIAENKLKVAWIESDFSIFPFAFLQRNVALDKVLFVESANQTYWGVLQVLKAQIFPVVVVVGDMDLRQLRCVQLASEKADACVLWLTEQTHSYWPVSLKVRVQRHPHGIEGQVLRQRF